MPRELKVDDFIAELTAMAAATARGKRKLVALAGPPGAGKSTLAEAVEAKVNEAVPDALAVLPMDGFHYDDELLVPRGWRAQKGAPHTFDVGGLAALLHRLKRNEEAAIAVPRFDRSLEIARAGARLIPQSVRMILVEGNYVLFTEGDWAALAGAFHLTAMVRLDEARLRRQLVKRWTAYGMETDQMAAQIDENDIPNGRMVYAKSGPADIDVIPQ